MQETTREKNPVYRWWKLLVRLIQRTFGDRNFPEEVTWVTMVFIPKGRTGYQGIGLVEVVWRSVWRWKRFG